MKKGTECRFDTDDLRRIANLRTLNQKLEERVTEYNDLVTRLQYGSDEDVAEILCKIRGSNDLAEQIQRVRAANRDPSASASEEARNSPRGNSPATESFRGSTWHPALRVPVASGPFSESSGRARSISGSSLWKDPESPSPRNLPSPHVELFGNFGPSGAVMASGVAETLQLQQSHRIPIYFVQSSVVIEDSPLSRVYTDYRDAARQLIAGGAPLEDIMGSPDYIDVDLYFRTRQNDNFSANFWACEALKSFNEFDHLVKLGSVALITHLMRVSCIDRSHTVTVSLTSKQWTIHPTAETYERIPDMMRPTPTQLLIPHIPAIDIVPM